ncbi:MAG TPA: transposase [Candidatus Onthomonas avicola]|nr:transposase [Candidatus Onthomonas avicola]
MGKWYTKEERREALKLAEEIGPAAAARRLGINADTLYGWRGREKERAAALEVAVGGRSEAELLAEIKALGEQLKQAQQDVGILQEALFLPSAGDRESRP